MAKAWVYSLHCANGARYVGYTTHLELHLTQHQAGDVAWTRSRRPLTLVYSQEMPGDNER